MDAGYAGRLKLASIAARLAPADSTLPALFLFTDPERTPDPVETVRGLPPRCGVVYRHFGAPERLRTARDLHAACEAGSHVLLIAGDPELAAETSADGVHWPRWMRMPMRHQLSRHGINTTSAHGAVEAAKAARAGADIVFLSPVFRSESPSAGRALGVVRAGAIARATPCLVYALGGVTLSTAPHLAGAGIAGIAAVGALAGPAKPAPSATS